MPWREGRGGWQGGGGQGPWDRGPGGPQPPDLEDLLRKGQDRFKRVLPGGIRGGSGLALIALIVVAVWLASGLYRVQPDEQGVELVFGAWVATTTPGLNYNWPSPIGQVYKPKVTRVHESEVGFRSTGDLGRAGAQRQVPGEALMLTGDENIVDINFVVFWVIKDAGQFLFKIESPEQTVKNAAESVMREVIGKTEIATALAEGRLDVEVKSQNALQDVLDSYEAGIQITRVQLQKVDPPAAVIDSFRDVQAARADQERLRNEAEAYRNDIIPRARGEAAQVVQEAEAYKQQIVAKAEGEAQRFLAVYKEYAQARDVTVRRIYLETMEEILAGMNKLIIDTGATGTQGVVPYLPLNQLERRRTGAGE